MQYHSLEEALAHPATVKKLVLAGHDLKRVPAIIWQKMPQLEQLDLSYNQIKQLPAGLGKLTQLRKLCLSHNRITQIKADLDELTQLKHLDLSHNRLRKLPFLPDSLENLDLSHNKLNDFPISSYPAKRLLHLNLSNNKLQSIGNFAFAFPDLQYLKLNRCKLIRLPDLPNRLYALDISHNPLEALPPNWRSLQQLQRMELKRTPLLLGLNDFSHCSKLTYLDIRQNPSHWTGVEALLIKLPKLRFSFGGLSAKIQGKLEIFLDTIPESAKGEQRAAYWQLWQGFAAVNITDKVLWSCLQTGMPTMLQIGAYYELVRRHPARYGHLLGRKWWIVGTLANLKSSLAQRLSAQGVQLSPSLAAANGIILGHLYATEVIESLSNLLEKPARPIFDELQIVQWLDRREKRYLTQTRDRNDIANLERMLLAKDKATFQLGVQLMRAQGTPLSLRPLLLKRWLDNSAAERENWEDILIPYLPGSLKIALEQEEPLPSKPSRRGAEGQLWKILMG